MQIKDSHNRYGAMSIFNHWVVGLAMIAMLIFGLYIEDLPRGPEKFELIGLHKSIGVLILFYGAWRVLWRLVSGFLTPAEGVKALDAKLAKIGHWLLLLSVIVMPLSGYIMSETKGYAVKVFGWFTMPEIADNEATGELAASIHEYFGIFILVIIGLHILAALKHHFINKDKTYLRMLGKG